MKFGTTSTRRPKNTVAGYYIDDALNLKGDDKEDEQLRFRSTQSMVRQQNSLVSSSSSSGSKEHLEEKKEAGVAPTKSASKNASKNSKRSSIDEDADAEDVPKPRRVMSVDVDKSLSATRKIKSKRNVVEEEEEEDEVLKLRRVKRFAPDSCKKSSKSQESGALAKMLQKEEERSLRRAQIMMMSGSKSVGSRKILSSRSSRSTAADSRKPRKGKRMVLAQDKGWSSSRSLVEGASSSRRSSGSSKKEGEECRPSKSKSFVKAKSLSRIRLDEEYDDDDDDQSTEMGMLDCEDKWFVKKEGVETSVDDDHHSVELWRRSSKVEAGPSPVPKAEIMAFLTQAAISSTSMTSCSSEKSKMGKNQQRSKSFVKHDSDEATAATSRSSISFPASDEEKSKRRSSISREINNDSVNKILAESVAREIFTDEGGDDLECGISELDDSVSYRLDQDSLFCYNKNAATMGDGLMKDDLLGDAVDYHATDHPETLILELGGGDDHCSSKMYKILSSQRRLRCLCFSAVFLAVVSVFSLGLAFGLYHKNQAVVQGSAAGSTPSPYSPDSNTLDANDSAQSGFTNDATKPPEKGANIEVQDSEEDMQIGGRIPPPMNNDASAGGNSFVEGLDISCEPNC